jgi:ATP-dependent DNA ligase
MTLPPILPMLAQSAEPFDSNEYEFEVKWDGIRALVAVTAEGWRSWGRDRADYTARYPDLAGLSDALPAGTVVDGELVAFRDGRPSLPTLLRRHGLTDPVRIARAWRWCPVQYVLFDLLYEAGQSLLHVPLEQRRQRLAVLSATIPRLPVLFSAGVIGQGRALYEQALAAGHEGVMAKLRSSPYRPGQRSPAWRKIKPRRGVSSGRLPRSFAANGS